MSSLMYIVPLTETVLDDRGRMVDEFPADLPHAEIISRRARASWDSIHFERALDEIPLVAGGVERAPMVTRVTSDGRMELEIRVVSKRGFRLGTRRRNAIFDELDRQMMGGWGKAFFGSGNTMADADGTWFFVDKAV